MNQHISKYFYGLFLVVCLGATAGIGWAQQSLPPEVLAYADIVLYNGKILTVDEQFTIVEAVAIRGDKVLAVGDSQRILAMAGPRTRRVDLQGQSVVPGFIDTHLHSAWVVRPRRATGEAATRPSPPQMNFDTL